MPPGIDETTADPPGLGDAAWSLIRLTFRISWKIASVLPWQGWIALLVFAAVKFRKPLWSLLRHREMRGGGALLTFIRVRRLRRWGASKTLARRLQKSPWESMTEHRGLTGLRRGRLRRTPFGLVVNVRLGGNLTAAAVSSKLPQIETGLGAVTGSAQFTPGKRADKATLSFRLRDPLANGVPWTAPSGPVRLADPMRLSVTPFGDTITVDVRQRIGVFGTSGSGKSCVQRLIGAHVIQAIDADMEIWDLKFGTESQHYAGKAHRVTTVPDAVARTEWLLNEEFPRRAARMAQLGTSSWKETPQDPALVLMVDEGNVLIREFTPAQLKRFFRVAEQGRALGCYITYATQFPKASNLPTELRSQLNCRISMRLMSSEESAMVFKDEVGDGWLPHKLPGTGWLLIKDEQHPKPDESRAVWLDEDTFKAVPLSGTVPAAVPDTSRTAVDLPVVSFEDVRADSTPTVVLPVAAPVPDSPSAPTVADDVRLALAFADHPYGVRELASAIRRDPGAVSRALRKLTESGEVTRTGDKFALALAPATRPDFRKEN